MGRGPSKFVITFRHGKKHYDRLRAAWDDLRHDYLVNGMGYKAIYDKYIELVDKPFGFNSMKNMIQKDKLPALRKKIALETGAIMGEDALKLQTKLQTEGGLATELAETVISRIKRGAHRHFNRQESLLNKAHEVLDSETPNKKSIGPFLHNIDKFDVLARRLYLMDNQEEMDSHKRNIAILVNIDKVIASQPSPQDNEGPSRVTVDAELIDVD